MRLPDLKHEDMSPLNAFEVDLQPARAPLFPDVRGFSKKGAGKAIP